MSTSQTERRAGGDAGRGPGEPVPAGTAGTGTGAAPGAGPAAGALRPRPAISRDIAFFFEGAERGDLLIQRCEACGTLRHPPLPSCPECRSFAWDTVVASGRGTIFSFVVTHHPQLPAFDYPLVIAVIELEEGTRLVANVDGVAPEDVYVGMPVLARMVEMDPDLTLPVFSPDPDGVRSGAGAGAVD